MDSEVELLETSERASRTLPQEIDDLFAQGADLLERGCDGEAVERLRRAAALAPEHAQIRSLLGVALARVGGQFEEARSLCESAARQEFFNPNLYLNLAQIYLGVGRRSEALRYLRRGQMIDPGHEAIRAAIAELGMRRDPVVPFLPRRHPLNRALGTARNLVMSGLGQG